LVRQLQQDLGLADAAEADDGGLFERGPWARASFEFRQQRAASNKARNLVEWDGPASLGGPYNIIELPFPEHLDSPVMYLTVAVESSPWKTSATS
jgi:hypothetical protein